MSQPDSWITARLDEVADVRLGRQRSPKNHFGTRMRPYVRAANVTWEGLDLSDVKQMQFTGSESITYELRAGDVLVGEASGSIDEVGKTAIWRDEIGECCFQNTLLRIRSGAMSPEYLRYFLFHEARSGRVGRAARGVGIHHIGAARMSAWPVPVPPLAEQRRIVAAIEEQFSRLDAADRLIRTAELRLSRMPAVLLNETFLRFPDRAPLRELADVRLGRQRSPKNHTGQNMKPYLRAANVKWSGLQLSDVKSMHFSEAEVETYRLRLGDVLLSEASGSASEVGKPAIWLEEIDTCCFQNTLIRVRSRGTLPQFLRFVFLHAAVTGQFAQASPGVGIHHLGAERLASWPIPVANDRAQAEVVAEVEQQLSLIDSLRAAVESAQKRSAALRRAILERAFRGELVPQDPADEPASDLLERIRSERAAAPPARRRRAS